MVSLLQSLLRSSVFISLFNIGLTVCFTGCVMGFVNSENQSDSNRTIRLFVPAALDHTFRGGQSTILSRTIRSSLSKYSMIRLTDASSAHWGLDVRITDRTNGIESVDDCEFTSNPDTQTIANGAISCTKAKNYAPYNFVLPNVSPKKETLGLKVKVTVYSLSTGNKQWSRDYFLTESYESIGDPGDNSTTIVLSQSPHLHALRHNEAQENATKKIASRISEDLTQVIINLP